MHSWTYFWHKNFFSFHVLHSDWWHKTIKKMNFIFVMQRSSKTGEELKFLLIGSWPSFMLTLREVNQITCMARKLSSLSKEQKETNATWSCRSMKLISIKSFLLSLIFQFFYSQAPKCSNQIWKSKKVPIMNN